MNELIKKFGISVLAVLMFFAVVAGAFAGGAAAQTDTVVIADDDEAWNEGTTEFENSDGATIENGLLVINESNYETALQSVGAGEEVNSIVFDVTEFDDRDGTPVRINILDSNFSMIENFDVNESDVENGQIVLNLSEDVTQDFVIEISGSWSGMTGPMHVDKLSYESTIPNTAPSADAGADQTVEAGSSVTFDASGSSDADGDSLSYSWDVDGDGAEDYTGVSPSHTFDSTGTYTVDLTVDDGSATTTDSMTVTVDASNDAPAADAGANQTVEVDEEVTLDASGSSDPDGDSLTYEWDVNGDGTVDHSGVTASHTWGSLGTYTVDLTVKDSGLQAFDSMTVTVEEATYDQTVTVSDEDGNAVENATVIVTDNSDKEVASLTTDANGSAVAALEDGNYSFDVDAYTFDSSSGEFAVSGESASHDVTLAAAETHTIDFDVVDGDAVVENATVVVTTEDGTEVANLSTDSDGYAVTENIESGNHSVTIDHASYSAVSQDVKVDSDLAVNVDYAAQNDSEEDVVTVEKTGGDGGVGGGSFILVGMVALLIFIGVLAGTRSEDNVYYIEE